MSTPTTMPSPEPLALNTAQATSTAVKDTADTAINMPTEKSPNGSHDSDSPVAPDYFDESGRFLLEKFSIDMREQLLRYGVPPRQLGVSWRKLTVQGLGSGYTAQETVTSALASPFALLSNPSRMLHRRPAVKTILDGVSGVLKPGEMLLVLGRPGAGCSTMLKMLASYRNGFHSINGDFGYTNGVSVGDIEGSLRGDVIFAPEDDIHFPTLTVLETLSFAAAARAPQAAVRPVLQTADATGPESRNEYSRLMVNVIARVLGIHHTFNTKVGNDVIRGVSGGERKRVTVAEALASRARLAMFDNSSRGLDSSTALEFVQTLRIACDVCSTTVGASLYQASDNMTRLFDKVLLLNAGRQVYFGPVTEAVAYFERLGFKQLERQTIADFLVSCASGEQSAAAVANPNWRADKPPPPLSAVAQQAAWLASAEEAELQQELRAELDIVPASSDADQYRAISRAEKASTTRAKSKYTISFPMQVRLAFVRRAQILRGDMVSQAIPILANVFQSVIVGSMFVKMPQNSANLFSRGGMLFTALLFNTLMTMSEITRGYQQRPIVIRHKQYAYLHPAADALADALLDIPLRLVSVGVFCIIIYFITGLATTADQFFVFYGTIALACYVLVAYFRMLAALFKDESRATMVAGLSVIDMVLYTGYSIPRPGMRIWWKWLSYCNPLSFSFEILISNEFRRLEAACTTLVPNGAGYDSVSTANQVCPVVGARPGQTFIHGADYVADAYGYSFDNAPRNAGILFGFWFFFLAIYVVASEWQTDPLASGSVVIFKQGSAAAKRVEEAAQVTHDEEKGHPAVATGPPSVVDGSAGSSDRTHGVAVKAALPSSRATVSWRDVSYEVQIKTETRQLLHNVAGFVQPGTLTALMGTSGAGKTTLLNVLAQRTGTGVVTGQILVDGARIPRTFQADTGYCQQQDIHLDTQTVRESLQFSALLRQPAHVPREEKLAYVEEVLDMLEIKSFADAVVGRVGEGLNLEQRKMLTVGVELAAKPKLLLFLDEPTSGLDSIAAWSIVRLLKKLAASGQSILCTIHQPSGELFNEFDSILLLQKGGKMVYFGETGDNSSKLVDYFEHTSGQACPADANPAEYMLDVLGHTSDKIDWHQAFLDSTLNAELDARLLELDGLATSTGVQKRDNELQGPASEYAAPLSVQFTEQFKRVFSHYHRSTTYIVSKCALQLLGGLFIGSSFWGRGKDESTSSLQSKIFAIFMALVPANALAQQLQPMFMDMRSLYEVRERPSKMFTWPVAVLSLVLVEVPWGLLSGTMFWLPWYWMTGYPSGTPAGVNWGVFMLYQLFFSSLAQAFAAIAPDTANASILFSTFYSFAIVFCGVLQPPSSMPYFWRSWMYHLSPFTYFVEGMLGPVLGGKPIRCLPNELNTLAPPSGQSCDAYLGAFSASLDAVNAARASDAPALPGVGYFVSNTDGTCGYCAYRVGDDFLATSGYGAGLYGRDIGIIVGFILFNYALCLGCFYAFRIAKWNFSMPSRGASKKQ